MSVSIGNISGVESVHVLLNRGLVDVKLKPGNMVKSEQIRKAIKDDAFTPKDARVVVIGQLASQAGKLQFKVAGTNEIFPVASTPHKSWQSQVGRELTVDGLISTTGTLQITSVSRPLPAVQ
ncbi:MAG: hypothetical protein KGM47_15085 [Acidobacteriota bacterium]|nr:hypothetical protein [Acidobacteriota bacterium]